jgi:hypothetical protein
LGLYLSKYFETLSPEAATLNVTALKISYILPAEEFKKRLFSYSM